MSRHTPTPLAGRTAVITGAGSGIGRSLARRLSAHGCPLALVDADERTLDETVAMLDGAAAPTLARTLDVRHGDALMALAAEVREWAPAPIGAVFNNAGVAMGSPAGSPAWEQDERVMAINFGGVVWGVRAFLPILLEQRDGAIVNTSSIWGLQAVPRQTAYCASKFAVRGYTEALRAELAGSGVRAVTVYPSGVKTNIVRHSHVDAELLDERTLEQRVKDFEARARVAPERAAEVIHRGVDAGKARILIGGAAHFVDLLARISPTHGVEVLERLQRLGRGRAAGASPQERTASAERAA
ncbi:MAG TPA: SDR family NAD(P)-dependent oxidoreductase [Solirubrobacteraceae bacterium]|nr:SDR family NAD(P)-dependent oxidoreductase [Solirubrobacteraceae bacterium]